MNPKFVLHDCIVLNWWCITVNRLGLFSSLLLLRLLLFELVCANCDYITAVLFTTALACSYEANWSCNRTYAQFAVVLHSPNLEHIWTMVLITTCIPAPDRVLTVIYLRLLHQYHYQLPLAGRLATNSIQRALTSDLASLPLSSIPWRRREIGTRLMSPLPICCFLMFPIYTLSLFCCDYSLHVFLSHIN